MPSVVWCGRAPFHVKQNKSEVQALMVEHDVFFLDLLHPPNDDLAHQQVMVATAHISSATGWTAKPQRDTQPECTCGPGMGCSSPNCMGTPHTGGATNVRFKWRTGQSG